MSARNPWPARIALALAVAVLIGYSLFGIDCPFYWGHHGYSGAVYLMRARTSLRNHTLAPCNWTGFDPPRPDALYLHHPIGYHHLLTLMIPIFGDHEWVGRLAGLLGTLLVVFVLYTTVRRFWSREAGALAVWIWIGFPFLTSFSAFPDPMMPTFACILWGVGAYLRLLENTDATKTRRLLLEAFFAYAICGVLMWEMYFIAPFIAVHAFIVHRRYRHLPRLGRFSPLLLHVAVIGAACVLMMAFHLWYTRHIGAWGDFIESYKVRKAPPSGVFVIERHYQWLDILYGAPPILLSLGWLVLFLARALLGKIRRRDLLPMTFLYVNSLYIWLFAEGSAVHLYRVFMYSGFFAIAIADLIVDIHSGLSRVWPRPLALAGAAAVLLGYFAVETPHAWANLLESRVMMGTHGQPAYDPWRQQMKFAQEVHRLVPPNGRLIIHFRHLSARKEFWYYLDRSFDEVNHLSELQKLPKKDQSVLLIDEGMLDPNERQIFRQLIRNHPVTYFDHFTMVELNKNGAGEKSYAFYDLPMSPSYRFWVSHKWAPLGLKRKAYLPGLCESLAVGAPIARDELPPDPPRHPALQACYHNALVARGEPAEASERAVLAGLPPLDAPNGRPLGDARVVAARRGGGMVRIVYRASGPIAAELRYVITLPAPKPPAPAKNAPAPKPPAPAKNAPAPTKNAPAPANNAPPPAKSALAPKTTVPPPAPTTKPVPVPSTTRVLPRDASLPTPADWRSGYLYVDLAAVPTDALGFAVELVSTGPKHEVLSRAELPH